MAARFSDPGWGEKQYRVGSVWRHQLGGQEARVGRWFERRESLGLWVSETFLPPGPGNLEL